MRHITWGKVNNCYETILHDYETIIIITWGTVNNYVVYLVFLDLAGAQLATCSYSLLQLVLAQREWEVFHAQNGHAGLNI